MIPGVKESQGETVPNAQVVTLFGRHCLVRANCCYEKTEFDAEKKNNVGTFSRLDSGGATNGPGTAGEPEKKSKLFEIDFSESLGEGGIGEVFKGYLTKDGQTFFEKSAGYHIGSSVGIGQL